VGEAGIFTGTLPIHGEEDMKIMSKKALIGVIIVVAVVIIGFSLYWYLSKQPEK